jgi:Family of unknown function (DUF6516)
LRVDEYFAQLSELISACPLIQLSRITYDHRGTHEGFVRGELTFIDESTLHLREYVDVENGIDRLMYVYQYMNPQTRLVFRYDNTGHHRELKLDSYPHHKHDGSEDNVIASHAPTLSDVLSEIQGIVELR